MHPTKIILVMAITIAASSVAMASDRDALLALAEKNNCLSCHAIDKKIVGPAYKDVAKANTGDGGAENRLIDKVRNGGRGVWGELPMPPNSTVKDADIKTMVRLILALSST